MSNRFVTTLAALIILGSTTLANADVVVYGTDTGRDSDPNSLFTNEFGFIDASNNLQKIGETLDPGCTTLAGGPGAPCTQPYSGLLPSNRNDPFAVPDDERATYRGLAWDPNTNKLHATIRGWRRGGDPDHLLIDPSTGLVREDEWPDSDLGSVTASLTYDPVDNLLYAIGNTSGSLFTYPLGEGNNTVIGNLPGAVWAIAIDKDDPNGILYGIGVGSNGVQTLMTINKTDGSRDSEINEWSLLPVAAAMTIIDGKIIFTANMAGSPNSEGGWGPGGKELWEVGLDGSNLTLLNFNLGRHVSALTTVPTDAIPEPSSLVLLAMGLMGLFGYGFSRRRKKAA